MQRALDNTGSEGHTCFYLPFTYHNDVWYDTLRVCGEHRLLPPSYNNNEVEKEVVVGGVDYTTVHTNNNNSNNNNNNNNTNSNIISEYIQHDMSLCHNEQGIDAHFYDILYFKDIDDSARKVYTPNTLATYNQGGLGQGGHNSDLCDDDSLRPLTAEEVRAWTPIYLSDRVDWSIFVESDLVSRKLDSRENRSEFDLKVKSYSRRGSSVRGGEDFVSLSGATSGGGGGGNSRPQSSSQSVSFSAPGSPFPRPTSGSLGSQLNYHTTSINKQPTSNPTPTAEIPSFPSKQDKRNSLANKNTSLALSSAHIITELPPEVTANIIPLDQPSPTSTGGEAVVEGTVGPRHRLYYKVYIYVHYY